MMSSDPRFVLHVGAHVTDARQVQRYLKENPDQLRQHGLRYCPRDVMSKYVDWGPNVVTDPEPLAEEVRRTVESPGVDGFLASHENTLGRPFTDAGGLYAESGPTLQALAEIAKPYRCTVVLSVRPQADFLESYYLQLVNEGEYDDFDTWLARLDLDDVSWLPVHQQLVGAFGADAVRVLDFHRVGSDPVAYVREFGRLIDLDLPSTLRVSPMRNVRPTEKGLQVSLAANPYLRTFDERAGLRSFLHKNFAEPAYPPVTLLSDEQRASLEARYHDEYEGLVSTDGEARP